MGTITNKLFVMCSILLQVLSICFAHNITAFFVFGDSLVEAGNNYYIDTLAAPGFPNGEELGFKDYTPPFLAPNTTGDVILKGVNYASSGAGILQATGSLFRLYKMDARKFVVSSVAKVGCIPFEIDTHICAQDCADSLNNFAKLLNSKLKSLVGVLTNSLTGSLFVYVDNYAIIEDIINNSRSYGFENTDSACCKVIGRHGGLIPCIAVSRVCPDRRKYVFWDPFHPTESVFLIAAKHQMDGGPEYASPVNIRQLVNS
ncbi:hypothetical protein V6N11_047588 [Hibiscus sabdariffa]|uniref:GDSL esterase/lipase n=1 Tax=Hibiscus sabdariffa TaxID=183260 RepID=A0ABR2NL13_9ROSI